MLLCSTLMRGTSWSVMGLAASLRREATSYLALADLEPRKTGCEWQVGKMLLLLLHHMGTRRRFQHPSSNHGSKQRRRVKEGKRRAETSNSYS